MPDTARTAGSSSKDKSLAQEQPPLPFSPWGPPPMAVQPAGAGAATPAAQPIVGPPLTARQVSISIAGLLLFLMLVLVLGRWFHGSTSGQTSRLPVLGVVGQAITIGDTVLGVAFTDTSKQFQQRTTKNGHFLSVGVVIGNRGEKDFLLDNAALGLDNGDDGTRYVPILTAWGTPEELQAGKYQTHYALSRA